MTVQVVEVTEAVSMGIITVITPSMIVEVEVITVVVLGVPITLLKETS